MPQLLQLEKKYLVLQVHWLRFHLFKFHYGDLLITFLRTSAILAITYPPISLGGCLSGTTLVLIQVQVR